MKTLKELCVCIEAPKAGRNYQTVQKEANIYVTASVDGAELIVYQNGYIVYRLDQRTATFPITACLEDYLYPNADGSVTRISGKEFEECDWTVRAVMEGELRIQRNIEKRQAEREFGASLGDNTATEEYLQLAREEIFVDPAPSWEEMAIRKETLESLRDGIKTLCLRQQIFLQKFYWEGKRAAEIAEEYGCSVQSVKNVLTRARAELRRYYEKLDR